MAIETPSKFFQWGPREAAVLPLTLTLEGAMTMDRTIGVSWPSTWILFQREPGRHGRLRGTWLNNRAALVDVGRHCFDAITDRGTADFFTEVDRASIRLRAEFKRMESLSLPTISDIDLEQAYRDFHGVYVAWWRPNYVIEPLEFFAELQSEQLFGDKGALAKVVGNPSNTMEEGVTNALDLILLGCFEEQQVKTAILRNDLLDVCARLRAHKDLDEAINAFRSRFYWVRNNYYRSGRLTFDETCAILLEHCQNVRTRTPIHAEAALEERVRMGIREMMQRDSGSPTASVLLSLWDQMAQFKDDRKKTNLVADHFLDEILREVCRRRHLLLADARNLLPNEVGTVIRGEAIPSLMDRRNGLAVVWRGGEKTFQCLYEPDMAALGFAGIGEGLGKATAKAVGGKKISGQGNGYGVVEGIAHVCASYEDTLRIPAGGDVILITYMTSPEWLSVIARVKGVVTEEGGQASHAFLSCSQMRKPLLIDAQGVVDPSLDGSVVRLDSNVGTLELLRKIQ